MPHKIGIYPCPCETNMILDSRSGLRSVGRELKCRSREIQNDDFMHNLTVLLL